MIVEASVFLEKIMYSIGQVAKIIGTSVQLIRHYEEIGMISPPGRGENNRRYYDDYCIQQLLFIRRGRDLGFSLEDIRLLLSLKQEQGHNTKVHQVAQEHLAKVTQKIQELTKLKIQLHSIIQQCKETPDSEACPIIHLLETTEDKN